MNLSLHSYLDMILNINDLLHYGLTKKGYKKQPYILYKGFQSPLVFGLEQSFCRLSFLAAFLGHFQSSPCT